MIKTETKSCHPGAGVNSFLAAGFWHISLFTSAGAAMLDGTYNYPLLWVLVPLGPMSGDSPRFVELMMNEIEKNMTKNVSSMESMLMPTGSSDSFQLRELSIAPTEASLIHAATLRRLCAWRPRSISILTSVMLNKILAMRVYVRGGIACATRKVSAISIVI